MIEFPCEVCRTALAVEDEQAGLLVRCPACRTSQRAPAPVKAEAVPVAAAAGKTESAVPSYPRPPLTPLRQTDFQSAGPSRRYGFTCGYCSSRLEANGSMGGQEGQCPTCGNQITIPILDRYGRLIDPKTRQIIKQDPHPVHAYAAAGERAPRIIRSQVGKQMIQCPRCPAVSPITANNCKNCGMPFTMEGTTIDPEGGANGLCITSLVLGIIGLPAHCAVIPPPLAILTGVIGWRQVTQSGGTGRGIAIAGIILGVIGVLLTLNMYFF